MLNPEFAELVKVGKIYYNGQANENLDIAVMENRAGTLALKAMQIINELKRNWTDDSIDYWKALRELCLMRPTLSRKNVEQNSQYQLVYMCAPGEITAYSYEQEGDYNKNINIKFDGSLPQKMSEDEVHLKEIMQIPGVKALFEKHGYATSFVPNEFILTPSMFNNIYKGALGEVVGKYILEQYAGVTLQEMPQEYFELFDYTLGNGVYVDFKFKGIYLLIKNREIDLEQLKKTGKVAISASAEGFLRGSVASSLTIACKAGKLGEGFVNVSPHVIGALTVICLDVVKSSMLVAVGKMTSREMGVTITKEILISSVALAGGAIGQAIAPELPVIGYMLGSLIGSCLSSVALKVGEKCLISFCVDSGFTCFGLVEQNYELPEEVLRDMGLAITVVSNILVKNTEIKRTQVRYTQVKHAQLTTVQLVMVRRGMIGVNKIGYVN